MVPWTHASLPQNRISINLVIFARLICVSPHTDTVTSLCQGIDGCANSLHLAILTVLVMWANNAAMLAFCILFCSLDTHAHTHLFYGPLDFVRDYPGEPVPEPIWILLKQESVSGRGISWEIQICTSPRTDNHASTPPLSLYRPDALPAGQPTASKH